MEEDSAQGSSSLYLGEPTGTKRRESTKGPEDREARQSQASIDSARPPPTVSLTEAHLAGDALSTREQATEIGIERSERGQQHRLSTHARG